LVAACWTGGLTYLVASWKWPEGHRSLCRMREKTV
jgi:hypothetical protein